MSKTNEFELIDCLLGCRRNLTELARQFRCDERNLKLKEVVELLDQLNVLIKMTKKGMKVSDT